MENGVRTARTESKKQKKMLESANSTNRFIVIIINIIHRCSVSYTQSD